MRTAAMILLGLVLHAPLWAQQDVTMRDARADCGALARTKAFQDNLTNNPTWLADLGRSNFIAGYIEGFVDALPDIDPTKTSQSVDAVCKYIDGHSEIWKLPRAKGLQIVVRTLYGGTK
jgi:hypothetical protein